MIVLVWTDFKFAAHTSINGTKSGFPRPDLDHQDPAYQMDCQYYLECCSA